jgi:hypothetical protein
MATDDEVAAEREATEELRAMLESLKNDGGVDLKAVENDNLVEAHRAEQLRLQQEIDNMLAARNNAAQGPVTTADAQAAMLAAAAQHQQAVADKLTGDQVSEDQAVAPKTKTPKAGSESAPATDAEGK